MTNDCKTCPVSTGTHKPAEAVHQIDEPQAEALRLADDCEESATHWVHEIDTRAKAAKMLRAQHARIAELEAELEAIGAGGVEPLRKQAAAPQAVQPAVQEGWQLVPIEPTREMLDAYVAADGRFHSGRTDWAVMLAAAPAHPVEAVQAAVPVVRGEVLVTVSGFTGSGKSAIAGEIEIMCRALGLQVEWPDGVNEKNMTHADWTTALELYNPRVRIIERNVPRNTASGVDQ